MEQSKMERNQMAVIAQLLHNSHFKPLKSADDFGYQVPLMVLPSRKGNIPEQSEWEAHSKRAEKIANRLNKVA